MQIEITLKYPSCCGTNVVKNEKKSYQVQNYQYKDCHRQFIGDHSLRYKSDHSNLYHKIALMLVRNIGIRDIFETPPIILSLALGLIYGEILDLCLLVIFSYNNLAINYLQHRKNGVPLFFG